MFTKIMLACFIVIMLVSSIAAQSLTFRPVYHWGQHTDGKADPGFD